MELPPPPPPFEYRIDEANPVPSAGGVEWSHIPMDEVRGARPVPYTYKRVRAVNLNVFYFAPKGPEPEGGYPAILLLTGGGFQGGTPVMFYPHARYWADRGFATFSADYRYIKAHGTEPRESLQDTKSCIRWLRQNAGTFNINPDRLVVGGFSAGGHLSIATAVLQGFDEPGEDTTISAVPDAVFSYCGVVDTSGMAERLSITDGYEVDFSPIHNIRSGSPPMILFWGTEDGITSPETAREFADKMTAAGNRCDLHLFEGVGHGSFNYAGGDKPHYYFALGMVDDFLVEHGYVGGHHPDSFPEPDKSEPDAIGNPNDDS